MMFCDEQGRWWNNQGEPLFDENGKIVIGNVKTYDEFYEEWSLEIEEEINEYSFE